MEQAVFEFTPVDIAVGPAHAALAVDDTVLHLAVIDRAVRDDGDRLRQLEIEVQQGGQYDGASDTADDKCDEGFHARLVPGVLLLRIFTVSSY